MLKKTLKKEHHAFEWTSTSAGSQMPSGRLVPAATDDATDSLHLVQWTAFFFFFFFFFFEARSDPCFVCPSKISNRPDKFSAVDLNDQQT